MQVQIKETNEIKELTLNDPKTNTDYVVDFIGNTGALDDGQFFDYDDDTETYTATRETFDWWETVVGDNQALEDRLHELRQEHGIESVHNAIGEAGNCDLEDMAANMNTALDENFSE